MVPSGQPTRPLRTTASHSGKRYVVYGEVNQFDSATGDDTFLADTAYQLLQRLRRENTMLAEMPKISTTWSR